MSTQRITDLEERVRRLELLVEGLGAALGTVGKASDDLDRQAQADIDAAVALQKHLMAALGILGQ